MTSELLKIEGLAKHFGGVKAVNDVTFTVKNGTIKAIIGPNGAGKTTIFNLIAGNLQPTSGKIFLEGRDVTQLPDYHMAYYGVARTFQTTRIFQNMSVLENAMLGLHTRTHAGFFSTAFRLPGMIREERHIRNAAMESLEFVGLKDLAETQSNLLTFKQQRLLEFARALALKPKILLADEPAAGLNTRETKDIALLIQRIYQSNVTVLLVEHDMSLVMGISSEILVLNFGKRIAEGTPAQIRQDENVINVYLGRKSRNA